MRPDYPRDVAPIRASSSSCCSFFITSRVCFTSVVVVVLSVSTLCWRCRFVFGGHHRARDERAIEAVTRRLPFVQAHEAGEMSGYLVKKGGASGSGMHNWKKRWVSLREGQWAYCQTHKMVDNPKDRLSLKGCLVKTREDKGKGHHENCFEIVFPDSKVTGERQRGIVTGKRTCWGIRAARP